MVSLQVLEKPVNRNGYPIAWVMCVWI